MSEGHAASAMRCVQGETRQQHSRAQHSTACVHACVCCDEGGATCLLRPAPLLPHPSAAARAPPRSFPRLAQQPLQPPWPPSAPRARRRCRRRCSWASAACRSQAWGATQHSAGAHFTRVTGSRLCEMSNERLCCLGACKRELLRAHTSAGRSRCRPPRWAPCLGARSPLPPPPPHPPSRQRSSPRAATARPTSGAPRPAAAAPAAWQSPHPARGTPAVRGACGVRSACVGTTTSGLCVSC